MDDTVLAQFLTLILSIVALLIAVGRVMLGRINAQTKQEVVTAEINLLRHQLETLREKSDVDTRELVNDILQQCIEDNSTLQERIKRNELQHAEERGAMYTEMAVLRNQLSETRDSLHKLELIVQQRDARIAELERNRAIQPTTK